MKRLRLIIAAFFALALVLVLAKGVKAEAAYKDKVTTPYGLILQEGVMDSMTGPYYSVVGFDSATLPKDLTIPEFYNSLPIIEISSGAFKDNKTLKSVLIPASVRRINADAFKGCSELGSVAFGGNVGDWIKKTWPEGKESLSQVVRILPRAFADCTSLTSFELNFGWDSGTGSDCGFLTNSGVKYLKAVVEDKYGQSFHAHVFDNCPELEKIDIIVKTKNPGMDLQLLGNDPKLKEINIYYQAENDGGMITGIGVSDSTGKLETQAIMNCPALEYINIYMEARVIGKQFSFFTLSTCEAAFEGENVHRKNNKGNTFVIDGEGTTVFSVEGVPFKARLTVSGGSTKKSIADAKAELPVDLFTYTGDAIEPYVILTYEDAVLVEDTDFTCEFKDNKQIGTATVTLKGMGDYEGELSATFTIIPPASAIRSIKNSGKKYVISWNKRAQADGYQIYYSSKKTKGYKKLYSGTELKTSSTKLKSGMYIKVRTYKKVGKTTYYSEWSAPVKVQ